MASPLENRIPPPVVTLLMGAAMGAASLVTPAIHLPPLIRFAAIGLFMLIAAGFGAGAVTAFARARTTVDPVHIGAASSLVTTGVYGFSRNPMYVALSFLLVSLALALSNAWLLLGPLAFIIVTTRLQIIPEERVLLAKFGEPYAAYRRRVRRWL